MRAGILGCGLGLALLWAGTAGAAVVHVDCAHQNLQNKINNAAPGSTLKIRNTCLGRFTVAKNVKLVGDPTATLDGDDAGSTLTVNGGPVVLSHLKITGGLLTGAIADGGGIVHSAGALTLRHVTVAGNRLHTTSIATGGGIFSNGGSLAVLDSVIEKNLVKQTTGGSAVVAAGGIYRSGDVKIVDSTIRGNRAVAFPTGTNGSAQGGGVFLTSSTATVEHSTFTGNLARVSSTGGPVTAEGGGLYLDTASPIDLEDSKFEANRAAAETGGTEATARGGGIYAEFSGGAIERTKFLGNTTHTDSAGDGTAKGAGGLLHSGLEFSLDHVRVSSNSADSHGDSGSADAAGGGLAIEGLALVKASTFDANTADAPEGGIRSATGGGLDIDSGGLRMTTSTVSRNQASAPGGQALGGGIRVDGTATSSVKNSTVAANRATGNTARGGGIDSFVSSLSVVNGTIAGNSAKLGGGLYRETNSLSLEATILATNSAPTGPACAGSPTSAGHNLIGNLSGCGFAPRVSDIVGKGAKLGSLGKHGGPTETISLLSSSPAINAIPAAQCAVAKDQRGVKRPQGPRCDVGAFEVRR